MKVKKWHLIAAAIFSVPIFKITTHEVSAHCDTMDGPVITEAKLALEKGNVTGVLKWVKKEQEQQVSEAFEKTLKVRVKGQDAKELADTYFFETLVRLHRESEGAAYTGLKPEGVVEPAIAAADKALETGSVDELVEEVKKIIAKGITDRFVNAVEKKKHVDESVKAGREYVEAYIEFVHYVEAIHNTVAGSTEHNIH